MPEPRSYLVGLPAVVTVHDDGTVTYWVDTSETGVTIFDNVEDDDPTAPSEEQMLADQQTIDADHLRRFDEKRQTL